MFAGLLICRIAQKKGVLFAWVLFAGYVICMDVQTNSKIVPSCHILYIILYYIDPLSKMHFQTNSKIVPDIDPPLKCILGLICATCLFLPSSKMHSRGISWYLVVGKSRAGLAKIRHICKRLIAYFVL